jgi:hypothetical protein
MRLVRHEPNTDALRSELERCASLSWDRLWIEVRGAGLEGRSQSDS